MESGTPFHANRDFRMNIVIGAGGLRDVKASEYRNNVLDVAYADPQAGAHIRQGALTETDQLLPILKRASAITTIVRDRCPSTSAATNSPPLRWKPSGASERKAAT